MLTPEQLAKIHQKDAALPDALKRDSSVNYYEGWFFVTLNTEGKVPVLSVCQGSPGAANGTADAPRCVYTELGKGVVEVWKSIPSFHRGVMIDMFEAMPEHVHGLLYLKPGNREHLGQIVKGFMVGCCHAYWDTLGIDWRKGHPTCGSQRIRIRGVATPECVDRDHTHSFRGPALFVHGYNDMEPITAEEVEIKRAYIRDQARKRLIQGDRHECFRKYRHQHSSNWTAERCLQAISSDTCFHSNPERLAAAWQNVGERLNRDGRGLGIDYIGNRQLLLSPVRLPLICHRADAALFERQKAATLEAARRGAVVVSAFISPKERDIKKQLMAELLPFIEIMDNGFSEKYKGVGQAFYALAGNRLLQLSPWSYRFQKESAISREMCLLMNELARIVGGVSEDWWRG